MKNETAFIFLKSLSALVAREQRILEELQILIKETSAQLLKE